MSHCYRIVYCSRSKLHTDHLKASLSIRAILAKSRLNNFRRDITGALLFGGTCFAQVIEGELDAVLATMDRIIESPFHTEITVLQRRTIEQRSFPNWSMAYAGLDPADEALAGELLTASLDEASAGAARLHGLLKQLAVEGERWIEPFLDPWDPMLRSPPPI